MIPQRVNPDMVGFLNRLRRNMRAVTASNTIKDDHSVKALNPLFKEKYLTACNWSEYSNKPRNVSILVGVISHLIRLPTTSRPPCATS